MIGRIVGFLAGAMIATAGYGMLRPAAFAKYVDFTRLSLGPFTEYKTVVCWLIVALGLVVALAALQRPSGRGEVPRRKHKGPGAFAPIQLALEPEPAQEPAPNAHEIYSPEPAD